MQALEELGSPGKVMAPPSRDAGCPSGSGCGRGCSGAARQHRQDTAASHASFPVPRLTQSRQLGRETLGFPL